MNETYAIAENLVRAMRFFGGARAEGDIQDLPGVCLVTCGLNYAAFNAAILSEPAPADSSMLRKLIETPSKHFAAKRLRWTYWLCEGFLEPPQQRECRALFSRFGLSPLTAPPGMFAERLRPPERPLPSLTIRPVNDQATRAAFAHITSVAFEIPQTICRDIYDQERAWNGDFQGYLGYAGDAAITATAVVIAGGVVGLYSVGTLPQYRRRGYAEAIMRETLRAAQERTGIEASVLQATDSGISLYQRMGFRKLTKFSVYIS
jgi:ribosomal protein S18 acetylase RimI-like enzyme